MKTNDKKPQFGCIECGTSYTKWSGKCYVCGQWNTIVDESDIKNARKSATSNSIVKVSASDLPEFYSLDAEIADDIRLKSDIEEFDRVLGGGIVLGSVVLFGGEPGIGKSTILLQLLSILSKKTKTVYLSGEESISQIQLRAKRLNTGKSNIPLTSTTSLNECLAVIDSLNKGDVVVIDSIQTIYSESAVSAAGSVSQVRFCANELIKLAKHKGVTLFLVGHVTKDGQIAGPKILEHMVDTVLYLESDATSNYRILRTIKNRFGATNELGIFSMTGLGLQQVLNPSEIFLSKRQEDSIGSMAFVGIEGTRPLVVDIESLITPSYIPTPRRSTVGIDTNRLALIVAVLANKLKLKLFDKEIYVNVSGGLKIDDTGVDLAVATVLYSSLQDIPLPRRLACFGEVALSGEIRGVSMMEQRIKEAIKLGFTTVICPDIKMQEIDGIKLIKIRRIEEIVRIGKF